jgi:hypothetical protein
MGQVQASIERTKRFTKVQLETCNSSEDLRESDVKSVI